MAWTSTSPVSIGNATKKSDYDAVWDNIQYLDKVLNAPKDTVLLFGDSAAPTGWTRDLGWADGSVLVVNADPDAVSLSSGGSVDPTAHAHASGVTFGADDAHVHPIGTVAITDNASHTHDLSSAFLNSESSHTHDFNHVHGNFYISDYTSQDWNPFEVYHATQHRVTYGNPATQTMQTYDASGSLITMPGSNDGYLGAAITNGAWGLGRELAARVDSIKSRTTGETDLDSPITTGSGSSHTHGTSETTGAASASHGHSVSGNSAAGSHVHVTTGNSGTNTAIKYQEVIAASKD